MDITHITSLLGGIALFLYGMSIMGAGLEKLAGGKMQGVLQKLTSSTIKGVIFGTLITGVIQSSEETGTDGGGSAEYGRQHRCQDGNIYRAFRQCERSERMAWLQPAV